MAKTELTRQIEAAIQNYHPAEIGGIKINKFRPEHTGLEVPVECGTVKMGIIDAVRISEYFSHMKNTRICRISQFKKETRAKWLEDVCYKGWNTSEPIPDYCDCEQCVWNSVTEVGNQEILITCFEIKVTLSDFKSNHGHNFVGNLNFYVVPNKLYPKVQDIVPDDIGILVYFDGTEEIKKDANGFSKTPYQGLRKKKNPKYIDMSDEEQKWMIMSVMKRVRDIDHKKYLESIKNTKKSGGVLWADNN